MSVPAEYEHTFTVTIKVTAYELRKAYARVIGLPDGELDDLLGMMVQEYIFSGGPQMVGRFKIEEADK